MATQNANSFSISVGKTFSKIILPIIVLANANPVLAASKSPSATLREQELNSEKILIADFSQDLSNQIKREQRVREREERQAEYRRRAEERERERQAQLEAQQRYWNSLTDEEKAALIQQQREQRELVEKALVGGFMYMLLNEDSGGSSSEGNCSQPYVSNGNGGCMPDPALRGRRRDGSLTSP